VSKWLAGVAGVVAFLVLGAAAASAASAPSLTVAQPFSFPQEFADSGGAGGVVASALGTDGTAWVVVIGSAFSQESSGGFAILTRMADGTVQTQVVVPGSSSGIMDAPVLSVLGDTATVAWITMGQGLLGGSGPVAVHTIQCTLSGCGPKQVIAHWVGQTPKGWGYEYLVPQPALASSDGHTVIVYSRFAVSHPAMMWAQSDGSGFGHTHSFGVSGSFDPVSVSETGGRILAAWLNGPDVATSGNVLASYPHGVWFESSTWTASGGFSRVAVAPTGSGADCGELTAVATAGGAMLAWIQGSGLLYTQEGAYPNPVWVARVRAGLIGTPTRIHIYAIATSIAAAGDVVALGFEGSSDNATYGPTAVTTSVNGKPFSKPVPLDSESLPPSLSIDSSGDVLAAWFEASDEPDNVGHQKLAIASPGGAFGTPTTLGSGAVNGTNCLCAFNSMVSPLIDTVGEQSLVVWPLWPPPPTTVTQTAVVSGTLAAP
jgi:hypothetical protein